MWKRGETNWLAAGILDTLPGLDGPGYSLWAHTPSSMTDGLDDVAEQMSEAMAVPAFLHSSRALILPKGELLEEPRHCRGHTANSPDADRHEVGHPSAQP